MALKCTYVCVHSKEIMSRGACPVDPLEEVFLKTVQKNACKLVEVTNRYRHKNYSASYIYICFNDEFD